jgi:hypothetical protein
MNNNKATLANEVSTNVATEPSVDEYWAKWNADKAIAEATPCTVPGCDREMHDPDMDSGEWYHRAANTDFDGGAIKLELYCVDAGAYIGHLSLERTFSEVSPADLRAKADLYDGLPTLMRQYADQLEALEAGSTIEGAEASA